MSIPGFSADCAIGPVQGYRTRTNLVSQAAVRPALGIGWGNASSIFFWPCFRNCYDRCGGFDPDGDTSGCFGPCYDICNWNPFVVF